MKVIVVGGGGREHAVIRKLKESKSISELYCAPGNAGISKEAVCVPIKATDIKAIVEYAKKNDIGFAVIGPDDPLAMGAADAFAEAGIPVFGPSKNAAIIEYSKAFSKNLMKKYGIPTADYRVFSEYEKAFEYIKSAKHPLVIKADGLALGKGVIISTSIAESETTLYDIMLNGKFGNSGKSVVIEELLEGPEVTVLAFCDGKTIVPMVSSQDHKRAFDNDKGPNTGGMGAFAPSLRYDDETRNRCYNEIIMPTLNALIQENIKYVGVVYFGLMLTKKGPMVIEYNSRFGDPEAQAILPLLETDLFTIMRACTDGNLDSVEIIWKNRSSVSVVLASDGYPAGYKTGYEIQGLKTTENKEDVFVFHSGTKEENGKVLTCGGRVLCVTALGKTQKEAAEKAYAAAAEISFENKYSRKDIGKAMNLIS